MTAHVCPARNPRNTLSRRSVAHGPQLSRNTGPRSFARATSSHNKWPAFREARSTSQSRCRRCMHAMQPPNSTTDPHTDNASLEVPASAAGVRGHSSRCAEAHRLAWHTDRTTRTQTHAERGTRTCLEGRHSEPCGQLLLFQVPVCQLFCCQVLCWPLLLPPPLL